MPAKLFSQKSQSNDALPAKRTQGESLASRHTNNVPRSGIAVRLLWGAQVAHTNGPNIVLSNLTKIFSKVKYEQQAQINTKIKTDSKMYLHVTLNLGHEVFTAETSAH